MQFNGQKLEEYCDISSGGTPSRNNPSFYDGHINWAAIADIEKSDGIVTETKEKITPEGLASIGNRIFPVGTLLLAMYGSVGKVAITGKEMATNQAILGIRPKHENEVYIPYVKYWFIVNQHKLVHKARGGILKNLSAKIVRNLKINLPIYDDQILIANLLSHVESLIVKREESIKLLDKFLNSTFLNMFGDPVSNKYQWPLKTLSKFGTIDRGVSKHRPRNAPELLGGAYPLIQTGNVTNAGLYIENYSQTYSEIGLQQSKLWPKGTLCITIAANIAQTSILKFESCFPDSIVGMIVDDEITNNIYIHFVFKFFQKILEKNAPKAAQRNINLQILRNLKIPKPDKILQDKFAAIVSQTEQTKAIYQESLQQLNNLLYSLSQLAFKGELELTKLKKNESENHQLIVDQPDSDNIIIEQNITQGFSAWEDVAKPILGGLALGMAAGLVYDIFTTKNEIKKDSNVNDDVIKPQDFDEVYEAVARPISNTLEDGTTVSGFQIDEEALFSLIKVAANDGTTFDDIQNQLYAKGHAIAYDENINQRNAGLALKESVFKLLDNHELIQAYDEKRKIIVLKNTK